MVNKQDYRYPTVWDMQLLFRNMEEWEACYSNAQELIKSFGQFRNRIKNAENVLEYYRREELFLNQLSRLQAYAFLRHSKNIDDSEAYSMILRVERLHDLYVSNTELFYAELHSIPEDYKKAMYHNGRLEEYLQLINESKNNVQKSFNVADLSHLAPALSQPEHIYTTLLQLELPSVSSTLTTGDKIKITASNYNDIMYSNITQEDKNRVSRSFAARFKPFENTFAAILNAHACVALGLARLEGFDSVLEYQNHLFDLDESMFFDVIKEVNRGKYQYHRFLNFKKAALNTNTMYKLDLKVKISDFVFPFNKYSDLVEIVGGALCVLGDEYLQEYKEYIMSGHIEVTRASVNSIGGFTKTFSGGLKPFISLDLAEELSGDSLSVLAHEIGHALCSVFAIKHQPFYNHEIGTFMHEICAITNEILVLLYCIKRAKTKNERLYFVEQYIEMFNETFWDSARYGEFEKAFYEIIESGGSLSADILNEVMLKLNVKYWNHIVHCFDGAENEWVGISHMYQTYYIYQYAASFAYAMHIAYCLFEGDQVSKENYLSMLKKGASVPPAVLLQMITPSCSDVYKNVITRYTDLINEYEYLI